MIPEKIGRYEIKSQLGRGGMATVYEAYDPRFERTVAVKAMPREFMHEPEFLARFNREAKTIAALEHPAIVPVYDYGEENGQPYLVMRYMPGGSLADRLHDGEVIPPEEAARIMERIGAALSRAHSQGIVHRDLKPGNILFDKYGDAFLADFGIVRITSSESALTASGSLVGTPAYMSPEQVYGDKELDGRSDIYALGIIVFQMLTGSPPYEADTAARLMMKHVMDPVPLMIERRPDISADYDRVLSKAMAKERDRRYATASEFSSALTAVTKQHTIPDIPPLPTADPESTVVADPPPAAEQKTVMPPPPPPSQSPPPQDEPMSPYAVSMDTEDSGGGVPKWVIAAGALALFLCLAFVAIFAVVVGSDIYAELNATDAPPTAVAEATAEPASTARALASAIAVKATETPTAVPPTSTPLPEPTATEEPEPTVVVETKMAVVATSEAPPTVPPPPPTPPRDDYNLDALYGPIDGRLPHDDDEFLEMDNADVTIDNFVAYARVANPFDDGDWDLGLIFRQYEADDEFRLVLHSDGFWNVNDRRPGEDSLVDEDTGISLNMGVGEENDFMLVAQGDRGYLFVNGAFISILDLSNRMEAGDIGLGIGFYPGDEQVGAETAYQDFAVWPQEPAFGPYSDQLNHVNDDLIKTYYSAVDLKNFTADIILYNPYSTETGDWDYGFSFRDAGSGNQYWLVLTSDASWQLEDRQDGEDITIDWDTIDNFDTREGGFNRITLIVLEESGYLLVNDEFVTELDLSTRTNSGDISVFTAFFEGDEIEGKITAFDDFTIWPLP